MNINVYRFLICSLGLLFLFVGVGSEEVVAKGKKKKEEVKVEIPVARKRSVKYDSLFRGKNVENSKRIVTIHKIGAKLYFEFPMNLLNREIFVRYNG